MKKLLTVAVATASLALVAQAALADTNFCTKNKCLFNSLLGEKKYCKKHYNNDAKCHTYFKCTVDDKATWLKLSNHNVLISGFNKSGKNEGKQILENDQLLLLKHRYYDVVIDFDRPDISGKYMSIESDGSPNCWCIEPDHYMDQKIFNGGYGR